MSNTHFATAKFRQEGVHEWQAEEGSTEATNLAAAIDAQTEATLALAYEQRTANLISAFAHLREHDGITMLGDAYPLFNQIKERLDIE